MRAEFLVAARQRSAGGEHVPQVASDVPAGMSVAGLVSEGQAAGGHVGGQAGAGALAQPVQRAARLAGAATASNSPLSSGR